MRKAFSIKKWVVVALWRLSSRNCFSIVSKTFDTEKLTYYLWVLQRNIQIISSIFKVPNFTIRDSKDYQILSTTLRLQNSSKVRGNWWLSYTNIRKRICFKRKGLTWDHTKLNRFIYVTNIAVTLWISHKIVVNRTITNVF